MFCGVRAAIHIQTGTYSKRVHWLFKGTWLCKGPQLTKVCTKPMRGVAEKVQSTNQRGTRGGPRLQITFGFVFALYV